MHRRKTTQNTSVPATPSKFSKHLEEQVTRKYMYKMMLFVIITFTISQYYLGRRIYYLENPRARYSAEERAEMNKREFMENMRARAQWEANFPRP